MKALGVLALAVLTALGIVGLAELTQNRPDPTEAGSTTVVSFDVATRDYRGGDETAAQALWAVAHAGAGTRGRQVDIQAQREQAALARIEHEAERVEELTQPEAARNAHAGDAVGIERALGGKHIVDCRRTQRRQRHQRARIVDELAVELAILILADLAARWRLR